MDINTVLLIINALLIIVVVIIMLTRKNKDNTDYINDVINKNAEKMREEITKQIAAGTTEQFNRFGTIGSSVQNTLLSFQTQMNTTLKEEINALQKSNERRLDEMRGVVDEKLQKTLNERLTQSFEAVAGQLKSVEAGLGEMKNLAADAKSLKNALTNVKERGTYGEVRLERLLSDIMTPAQYGTNVEIADGKRVEFVIMLPGTDETPLMLPIDSKFPIEDYNRLLDADDKAAADAARKSLAAKLRAFAKDIHDKYIVPPKTTDFALMFLPTEGLYAETVRDPALFEELRDKYKVTPVGATTLSAFLASLQMGFKTLAVEQNAQGIMKTLGSVKSEFEKFSAMLEKAQEQIRKADSTLSDLSGTRTRAIKRALREVTENETNSDSQPLFQ
jgi:DNA recombination protein RmuC